LRYERVRETLAAIESPSLITSTEDGIPEYRGLNLPTYAETGEDGRKWFVVSGSPRSGGTVYTAALAASAAKGGLRVLALDLSSGADCGRTLTAAGAQFYEIPPRELLARGATRSPEPLALFADSRREVLRSLIPFAQARRNMFDVDAVIINVDLAMLGAAQDALSPGEAAAILPVRMTAGAIDSALAALSKSARALIWLNDTQRFAPWSETLSPMGVRDRIRAAGYAWPVISPVYYDAFGEDGELYSVIEGELYGGVSAG
jgi:hypothetical protein